MSLLPQHDVHPKEWMMPNRKGFPEWMGRTFSREAYRKEIPPVAPGAFPLFPHQRMVRDFLQFESPYRGLLLYHGLGVGKTCASIAAAEGFLTHGRKIVVMVPASLAVNYKQEIIQCSTLGNPHAKLWNHIEVTDPSKCPLPAAFVRKHKNHIWLPTGFVKYIGAFGKLVRRAVSWKSLDDADQRSVLDTVHSLIDEKYTFVNYNGLTLKAWKEMGGKAVFEGAFVVMDEAHNFISRVANGGKVGRAIYEAMMQAADVRLLFLSGTPIINHPYELGLLLNVLRGSMDVYTLDGVAHEGMTETTLREGLGELSRFVDHLALPKNEANQVHFTLPPKDYVYEGGMLRKQPWKQPAETVVEALRSKIATLFPAQSPTQPKRHAAWTLPPQKDDFVQWFMDMSDPDHPKPKNMDLFMRRIMGLVSYFRTAGDQYFPTVLFRRQEKVPMSDYQFRIYTKVRKTERDMETRKKRMARMAPAPTGVFSAKGTVYRAFSRMACNFVFPEDIKRLYPMELRKEMERVLEKELDTLDPEAEDAAEDAPKEKLNPKQKDGDKEAHAQEKELAKEYEKNLRGVLTSLQKRAGDLLTPETLAQVYSPKMARMLECLSTSPGKSLVYSQFRLVEGLGVFQLALHHAGWVRVELTKKGNHWSIQHASKVLSKENDGKRYIVFDADREKTRVLLQLFNGKLDELPKELLEQLQAAGGAAAHKNLRGELISTLMITQSGAEGISLTNVRRVLIMEPFWNMVRIDQVIGRAVRTNSHMELPEGDRNVEVYIFATVLTEEHLQKAFTLKTLDGGLSSDSHIATMAEIKDEVIQAFLQHMKKASIDCRAHGETNRMMAQGMQCYSFPIPLDPAEPAFQPQIEQDTTAAASNQRFVRARRVRGRVVTVGNQRYVQLEEFPDRLYDYHHYKHAGVLTEVKPPRA